MIYRNGFLAYQTQPCALIESEIRKKNESKISKNTHFRWFIVVCLENFHKYSLYHVKVHNLTLSYCKFQEFITR